MKKQYLKKPKFFKSEEKKKEKSGKEKTRPQQIFPKNNRTIPETLSIQSIILNKYFLVSFISTFIGVAITLQGFSIQKNLQKLQVIQSERQQVDKEIKYWEGVTTQYKEYRDGYFKLATLEYQRGDKDKSQEYIEKALKIDPNFKEAIELGKKIKE